MSINHVQVPSHWLSSIMLVINLMVAVLAPVDCLNQKDGVATEIPETGTLSKLILSTAASVQYECKEAHPSQRKFPVPGHRSDSKIEPAAISSTSSSELETVDSSTWSLVEESNIGADEIAVDQELSGSIDDNSTIIVPISELPHEVSLKSDSNETTRGQVVDKATESVLGWLNEHLSFIPSLSCDIDCTEKKIKQKDKIELTASDQDTGANKSATSEFELEGQQSNGLDDRHADTTGAVLSEIRNDEKGDRLSSGGAKTRSFVKKHQMRLIAGLGEKKPSFDGSNRDGRSIEHGKVPAILVERKNGREQLISSVFATKQINPRELTNWRNMSRDQFAHLLNRFQFNLNSTLFHDVEDWLKGYYKRKMSFMHFG